jgi:hypothetical protein
MEIMMTMHRPRFFPSPPCFALPLLALAAIAALAVGERGESRAERAAPACGPAIAIQDPGLRASFARFDRDQSAGARKVCAIYRDWH